MKKVFKWIGIVLGSLVGVILVGGGVLFLVGNARLNYHSMLEKTK